MKEEYIKWFSPNTGRDIEILVYGHFGYPLLIFPSSQGRYYEAKDFKLIDAISWYINEGKIKVYCPDSIDSGSLYNNSIHPADRIKTHIGYDRFLNEELIEKIRLECNTEKIAITGHSFGAFHALNFAFRHPYKISHLFAMSGKYDIKSFMDGYYDDNVYFNNPADYMPNLDHPDLWNMKIVLGAGEHDICRNATEHMSGILNGKGIDHWLDIRQGAVHDWPVWREMLPDYLSQL